MSRIVYLVEKIPKEPGDIPFVDDAGLAELLAEGLEITSTSEQVRGGVKTVMMVLKPAADNRGVSVVPGDRRGPGELHVLGDEAGASEGGTMGRALATMTKELGRILSSGGGHLGSPQQHQIPGMTIIPGDVVAKAYDYGQNVGRNGGPSSECPFPSGSVAATTWLRGWHAGRQGAADNAKAVSDPEQLDAAYKRGKSDAEFFQDDPNVEVHCPFSNSAADLKAAWIRGFREGGGTVV